jgi:hypothetical protein
VWRHGGYSISVILVMRRVMSEKVSWRRRSGMNPISQRAAHSAARHVRKLLDAAAPDPNRLDLWQATIECQRCQDGVGHTATLVLIDPNGGVTFDEWWGFDSREALADLVAWVERLRATLNCKQAREDVVACAQGKRTLL